VRFLADWFPQVRCAALSVAESTRGRAFLQSTAQPALPPQNQKLAPGYVTVGGSCIVTVALVSFIERPDGRRPVVAQPNRWSQIWNTACSEFVVDFCARCAA